MPEYQPLLDGSQSFDDEEWIDALRSAGGPGPTKPELERSERYLQQHWIPLSDALATWIPLLQAVFRPLPSDAREIDSCLRPPSGRRRASPLGGLRSPGTPARHCAATTYAPLQALMAAAGDRSWALLERPHYGRWPDRHASGAQPCPALPAALPASRTPGPRSTATGRISRTRSRQR